MPTYEEVLQRLETFSLQNAANRNAAMGKIEEFMNEIRPQIDQVLRENPNLSQEEKEAFDKKEEAIFNQLEQQFPPNGGRRKQRRSRRRLTKKRKSRRNRRT